MEKVKCPHCGNPSGEIEFQNKTEYFICAECSSMFNAIKEDGKLKAELVH